MDQLINQNLEQREQTRAALAQKLELLQARLENSVEQVKTAVRRTTDVKYHVSRHPWLMIGLAILAGRILGGVVGGRPRRHRQVSRQNYATRQQRSVVKGAVIGAITSLTSEFARQAIPTLVRRMEGSWQNKPGGSESTQTRSSHYHER
ncbi:MAG TPA: hypothetical protein VIB79_15850 [Candidatus Binatia bacterium]|jgi:ElaB/YqjD/DUF883 family membrane-anchored ribosome-binding protein